MSGKPDEKVIELTCNLCTTSVKHVHEGQRDRRVDAGAIGIAAPLQSG
jgi:hypothetical protein